MSSYPVISNGLIYVVIGNGLYILRYTGTNTS